MAKDFQVVGIGNAIVDIFSQVDESFLKENNINKNVMTLTSYERGQFLLEQINTTKQIAGGSAANTIVGLSQLGVKTAYMGKVCTDGLGDFFASDLMNHGVLFTTHRIAESEKYCTGHCIVLITPDGERTMNTHLGVTEFLSKDDLDNKLLNGCEWLYLEGYRYDGLDSKEAFSIAVNETKAADGKIALSLSDPFCVERHRNDFLEIIKDGIDLVFCNEYELMSLSQEEDFDSALRKAIHFPCEIVCTASAKGAYVSASEGWTHIPTKEMKPYDTTGAGDLFASGFLFGLVTGKDKCQSGLLGNRYASEVIQTMGCRIDKGKMLELRK